MHDQGTSESFTRDVERILREAGRVDSGPADPDYRKDLILAAELAETDFSSESARRESVRRDLLTRPAASRARRVPALLAGPWRRPRLAAAAVAVGVVLTLLLAQSDLRATVVDPALRILKRLLLGQQTQAVVADLPGPSELSSILAERDRQLEAGEQWSMPTAVGLLGGDVPPGVAAVSRTYNSLGLAESAAAFPLREPSFLPEGYRFDRAVITPAGGVVLWYKAPGERITLYQKPTRPGATNVSMAMGQGSSMERVVVGGQPAAWLNGNKLTWEAGGRSYDLEGGDLTLAEALEIAESLR